MDYKEYMVKRKKGAVDMLLSVLIYLAALALSFACLLFVKFGGIGLLLSVGAIYAGYKVTSATWKENDIFYFIEPMEAEYTPKNKVFVESSSWGVLESKVTFIETR